MRRLLLASVVVAALAGAASATVVLRCGVDELTDLCDGAVVGTVSAKSVVLDREHGRIWTEYRVRVDETWVGAEATDVTVSVPGGEAAGVIQDFEGGATFEKGDRAAVFVCRRDDGRLLVLGEAQGAFKVKRDAATGADVCENSVDGLAFVDRAGKKADGAATRMTLDDLRTKVADARKRREERERLAPEAAERKLAARRKSAERHAEMARGKPGGPPAE